MDKGPVSAAPEVFLDFSLLQDNQLCHPFLIGKVFYPSDPFCGTSLDPLQQVHSPVSCADYSRAGHSFGLTAYSCGIVNGHVIPVQVCMGKIHRQPNLPVVPLKRSKANSGLREQPTDFHSFILC